MSVRFILRDGQPSFAVCFTYFVVQTYCSNNIRKVISDKNINSVRNNVKVFYVFEPIIRF